MTRDEIAHEIVRRHPMLTLAQVNTSITEFIEVLQEQTEQGFTTTLRGLGTFYPELHPTKTCVDPRNGNQIQVPERLKVKIVFAKSFLDRLKQADLRIARRNIALTP